MTDDISTRLASSVKRLREERGLSQAALAEQSGVPRPTIAHLESGQANPTLHVVLNVARALSVSVDSLVDPEEQRTQVLSARSLPTRKSPRVKRIQVVPPALFGHGEVERILVKPGGRFRLLPPEGKAEALVAEAGEFALESEAETQALEAEQVAWVRGDTTVTTETGGILYWVTPASQMREIL